MSLPNETSVSEGLRRFARDNFTGPVEIRPGVQRRSWVIRFAPPDDEATETESESTGTPPDACTVEETHDVYMAARDDLDEEEAGRLDHTGGDDAEGAARGEPARVRGTGWQGAPEGTDGRPTQAAVGEGREWSKDGSKDFGRCCLPLKPERPDPPFP